MLVAGVDSSTQSTKVVLCDTDDGTVVGRGSAPHPPGTEADPADWWAALRQAGDGLLDRAAAVGVAGQQHGRDAVGAGRLVGGQPAQLGHRERGRRHAAGLARPPPRAAELADQLGRGRSRPQVVPEQRGPDHLALVVEDDHPVLLPRHADGGRAIQQPLARLVQRRPPVGRVGLGAGRVRSAPPADDGSVARVAEHDLGGLGRAVHAGHEHGPLPCWSGRRLIMSGIPVPA